jgi:ribose transport system permease protein
VASDTLQPSTAPSAPSSKSSWATDLKYRWPARHRSAWVALALTVFLVFFSARAAFSGPSVTLVTALGGVLAIAALGQMLIIMLGAIDLSISAIVSVSAGMVVHYGVEGANVPLVLALALLVPILLSLFNGFLISVLRLNAVIVTLATVGMIIGAIKLWTGFSLSVTGQAPETLQEFAQKSVASVSLVFIAALMVAVVLSGFLNRTRVGRQIAEVGSNRRAARALGRHVTRVELGTFALAGLLYGIAGILLAGYVGTPDVVAGVPYQMGTIVVAGIAGALFSGGPAAVASIMSAALVLTLLEQAMGILGWPAGIRVVVQGFVLVLAVAALTIGELGASGIRRIFRSGA